MQDPFDFAQGRLWGTHCGCLGRFFRYNYKGNCRSFDFVQDDKLWVGVRAIPGLKRETWGSHCSCLGRLFRYNYKGNCRSFDFAQDDKLWVGVRAIPGLKRDILRLRSGQALGHPLFLHGTLLQNTTARTTADPSTSLRMTSCGLGFVVSQVSNATSFGSAQDRLWGTRCSCLGRFSKIQLQRQPQILRLRSG